MQYVRNKGKLDTAKRCNGNAHTIRQGNVEQFPRIVHEAYDTTNTPILLSEADKMKRPVRYVHNDVKIIFTYTAAQLFLSRPIRRKNNA